MSTEISRIDSKLVRLEERLVDLERGKAVSDSEFISVKSDLKDIKDSLTWVTRLILGALLLAVLAFVFGGGLVIA